jgi:hypothetical protein
MSAPWQTHASALRLLRLSLAAVWLGTAAVCLWGYPMQQSMALLAPLGVQGALAQALVIAAALLDAALGLATLCCPSPWLWRAQIALVLGYTAVITATLPQFWLHPFGPVLKNLPLLAILWVLLMQPSCRKDS